MSTGYLALAVDEPTCFPYSISMMTKGIAALVIIAALVSGQAVRPVRRLVETQTQSIRS